MCAGWLAFDAGRHDVSRNSFNEALGLAQQAEDAEAETHALANLAYLSNVLGSPKQARRWADAAERAAADGRARQACRRSPASRWHVVRTHGEQARLRARDHQGATVPERDGIDQSPMAGLRHLA